MLPPSRFARTFALALAVIFASACATTSHVRAADAAMVDRLLGLIGERLDLAPDVARTKWNTKAPIEDLARERQVIDGVANQASDFGLGHDLAESFFRGQIQASKVIQRALHVEWTAHRQGPFTTVVDLERDVRPRLDRLTPEMLGALAKAQPILNSPSGRRLLRTRSKTIVKSSPGWEEAVQQAVAPLLR